MQTRITHLRKTRKNLPSVRRFSCRRVGTA